MNFGDTGTAARFFYCAKADKQDRWGSRHPTVKPVELMKWLVPLVTPPGGLVLDPFAGSGTTGIAALATGRDCILIEREDKYVADIRERLAFYEGSGTHSVQARNRSRETDAGPLFAKGAAG
jgi:site-specific DNA-methyltransferase (adenine-specific)